MSKKQHNLMAMVANNPAKAKEMKIPKSVGEEYMSADKGMKFGTGAPKTRADRQAINQPKTNHGKSALFKKGGHMANTSRMNRLEELGRVDSEKAFTSKGKKNLAAEKKRIVGEMAYARGGSVKHEDVKMDKSMMQKAVNKHEGRLHKGEPMTKLAKGGTFRASANGIATKGKTKATQVTMKRGGQC